ncbi:DUF3721 domain-containing protein [Synechococcus sp. CS-1325]|uniref:DUF3721 domain-containing protein n=1 Tax=Synechococcus sp. CS-1325 TaxID=2847979 RepID=UPI000DAF936B|nr:DUF3721 domain-containing protein [Synechococcus sp. CS-1325]MCT0198870.1 DUF3721 domain-containing protein [Synechococcus sp. CS-1325]PZV00092.1 MAG: hypothetical protein DCF24_08000 [Cyanobium sp.]
MPSHPSSPRPQLHRWALLAALVALVIAPLLSIVPAAAHIKGMYKTRQEAQKRAAELKCKGTFAMGSMWMPCANEQALHKALQNE